MTRQKKTANFKFVDTRKITASSMTYCGASSDGEQLTELLHALVSLTKSVPRQNSSRSTFSSTDSRSLSTAHRL